MSVDMYLLDSQSQAASIANICRQQKQGYEELQQAINDFALNSEVLSGAAYDSAKQFFTTVLLPLSKAGILLSEAVMEACQAFPEAYIFRVDSGDLKESDLREKIEQINRHIFELASLQERLQSILFFQEQDGVLEGSIDSQMRTNDSLMDSYVFVKKKLEEKLDHLLEFNATSPNLFAEIEELRRAVSQGVELANTSWNAANGKFIMPKSQALSWVKSVDDVWDRGPRGKKLL
ncbi:hypothetical protein I6N95_22290 [Vagococcus sp. BWB3-3]|uniref:LXG domain-containing protein n=1 Tax=Vagococcus allomyrinae TaxID=2794353 RepID=A0A940PIY5_9ENTE|nr:hypothetical protein [Vagococcus allomyrinae]MBP1043763.1 hypothetical protein [Vagococcus allomyrinae]